MTIDPDDDVPEQIRSALQTLRGASDLLASAALGHHREHIDTHELRSVIGIMSLTLTVLLSKRAA